MTCAGVGQRLAADWHRGSSFRIVGSGRRVCNLTGTRPGDPVADLVFNLAFVCFQRPLLSFPQEADVAVMLQTSPNNVFGEEEEGVEDKEEVPLPAPAFMDDFTVLLQARTADEVVAHLGLVAAGMVQVAAQFGLVVNFERGKTEALVLWAGAGSQDLRCKLASAAAALTRERHDR